MDSWYKDRLVAEVARAVESFAPTKGLLVELELSRNPDHGDYSSNVAIVLSGKLGMSAGALAVEIAKAISTTELIARARAYPEGFLSVFVRQSEAAEFISVILRDGPLYGAISGQSPAIPPPGRRTAAAVNMACEVGAACCRFLAGKDACVGLALLSKQDLRMLNEPEEQDLIYLLHEFPRVCRYVGTSGPSAMLSYLYALCETFRDGMIADGEIAPYWSDAWNKRELAHARIGLIEATRIVLKNGLRVLGKELASPPKPFPLLRNSFGETDQK